QLRGDAVVRRPAGVRLVAAPDGTLGEDGVDVVLGERDVQVRPVAQDAGAGQVEQALAGLVVGRDLGGRVDLGRRQFGVAAGVEVEAAAVLQVQRPTAVDVRQVQPLLAD